MNGPNKLECLSLARLIAVEDNYHKFHYNILKLAQAVSLGSKPKTPVAVFKTHHFLCDL
jgi:hypothetical protein